MNTREIFQLLICGGVSLVVAGFRFTSSPIVTHGRTIVPSPTVFAFDAGLKPLLLRRRTSPEISPIYTPSLQPKTRCRLFFRAREEEKQANKRKASQANIPSWVFDELSRKDVFIPFTFSLLRKDNKGDDQVQNNGNDYLTAEVTIRQLNTEDLDAIVPLCVEEFGGGAVTIGDFFEKFPWQEPRKVQQYVTDWWKSFALPSFIYWTFKIKIVIREIRNPQDHALLVATFQEPTAFTDHPECDTRNDADGGTSAIAAMVELSKQPPDAYRNPTAYPLPMWYKHLYCQIKQLPPPDGWITNLLVAPAFRGQGYSKLLMAAAEGVARSWDCTSIQLHCDADRVGGKIPQRLYKGLGYEMVEDQDSPFAWMGSEFSNKIFMIEGVALLYFRKVLV